MKKLTKAEEDIMQLIWKLERATVSQMIDSMEMDPKPPHSSISSIVLITKEEYSRRSLKTLVSDYFEGSYQRLVSFLVKHENLDTGELNRIIDKMNEDPSP
jgi:BlaI family penicillinase repressor